jgi:hypothetical protein
MTYIVELVFNELGKKVCGADKKVFYVTDVHVRDQKEITDEYIEEHLFPVKSTNLVEHVYINKSFMECEMGEYLKAKYGNEEFLMKFAGVGYIKDTFIARRVDGYEVIEFHANGVERTRSKTKTILSRCTPEEIEEIKKRMIAKPFVEALEMLTNNIPGVTLDKDKIVLPEWMNEYKANEFYEMIDRFINK